MKKRKTVEERIAEAVAAALDAERKMVWQRGMNERAEAAIKAGEGNTLQDLIGGGWDVNTPLMGKHPLALAIEQYRFARVESGSVSRTIGIKGF